MCAGGTGGSAGRDTRRPCCGGAPNVRCTAVRGSGSTIGPMELPSRSTDARASPTRWAAPCATCASPSPTAATSAAPTACPRRSSGATTRSCPRTRSCRSRRSSGVARAFVALGVEKLRITGGEPLVRRDLPGPHRDAGRAAPTRRRRARPDAHDERLGPARAGPAAGRRGPAAGDGQPRLARRRGLRRDERRSTSRSSGCSTASTPRSRPASRRSRSTWSCGAASTSRASCRWRAGRARPGVILRFIEYMDVGHSNGWRLDEVVPAAELDRARSRRRWPVEPADAALSRRGRRPLAVPRRRAASSGSSRRSPRPFCRRLHAGAPVRRRQALHVPVRGRRAATSARSCAAAPRTTTLVAFLAERLARRDDRYSELRSAATTSRRCPRSRCSRWAAEPAVRSTADVSSTALSTRR